MSTLRDVPESVKMAIDCAIGCRVGSSEMPALIIAIHKTIVDLVEGNDDSGADDAKREPAVPIKKSIFPDYLVCLDDGRKLKSLKRHLAVLGMTPEQYRTKWGLPGDYPMVASAYAALRSELAKSMGLGKKG